ncbi:hypothetical protein FDI59_gp096 [Mycobacterium phage Yoshi]|uniref:Uncharacterized protein n=1 Tax=Mycobacterium phage Yoshi TaxID=2920891 RepID=G1BSK3_9CAUD|nr:hypothetical protein FDI59_gp096 [Mycobacterium phage Yoshi]AEK07867.1 hypothetical protein YOSHI_96 [Mycobacterium phage Yoshi]
MSEEDREQCEAATGDGRQCKRSGAPCIPDAQGLQYLCAQHWRNVCQHQSTRVIGPTSPDGRGEWHQECTQCGYVTATGVDL